MKISRNQLDYDINTGELRYSLEDLLLKNREELEKQGQNNLKKILRKYDLI